LGYSTAHRNVELNYVLMPRFNPTLVAQRLGLITALSGYHVTGVT
jgi:hypothetical protein